MYESRDFIAMPILADALQDAGCDNDDILNHCRAEGVHVRGCWVVDLVLGKDRAPNAQHPARARPIREAVVLILQGPKHPVEALTFAPDSTALFAVQGYHGIREWNLADRTPTRTEAEGRLLVAQYVFHPGGRWAFSRTAHTRPPDYNGGLVIDRTTGAARPFDCSGPRDTVAFCPDGGALSIGHHRSEWDEAANSWRSFSYLCWWGPGAGKLELLRRRELPANENLFFVVALGGRFVTAEAIGWRYALQERIDRLSIRRWSDGEPEAQLPVASPVQQLIASPDGSVLVARHGAELSVWYANDWTRPPITPHTNWDDVPEGGACFHPSGRFLLLVNNTASVLLFDTATWRQVQAWKWGAGRLRSVAVSPDGTLAAAGSDGGAVVVWDLDL